MDSESVMQEHSQFYARFQSFWASPTGDRVAELIAPDAQVHFTGAGTISGEAYIDWMADLLASMPDIVVTPIDYAGSGELIYIFWKASATINDATCNWHGVDRFRVKDGMAIEEYVIFDSALLQGPAEQE